jgi:hypothetical protein
MLIVGYVKYHYQGWNRHGEAVGSNLRLTGLPFDRSLQVDRPVAVRPVITGTPAVRCLTGLYR